MKLLLKRSHLNVQASVCDFIVKRNATTLYKSINMVNIHVQYSDSHFPYCYYDFEKKKSKSKQKKYYYQGSMSRRCSEKKEETIKINTSIPSCHCTMQKATFSCFLRFLTFPIEFGFLIEMDKFLEVKICFQFCI